MVGTIWSRRKPHGATAICLLAMGLAHQQVAEAASSGISGTYVTNPTAKNWWSAQMEIQDCTTSTSTSDNWECCWLASFYNNMSKWHAWQTRSWQDTTLKYEHFGNFNATATCYRGPSWKVSNWIRIVTEGTPNHPYASPSVKVELKDFDYLIRLGYGLTDDPTCSTGQGCKPCDNPMGFGTIGLALNGVSIFSSLSADYVDAIAPPSWSTYPEESLDQCLGHPNSAGTYHYHYMPPCMTGYNATIGNGGDISNVGTDIPVGNTACYDQDCPDDYTVQDYDGDANYASDGKDLIQGNGFKKGSALEPIGVAIDGYMIMGPYNTSGETISGLDNCNGKYHDDGNGIGETYRYYATETFPYFLGCFGPGLCNTTGNDLECTDNPPEQYCQNDAVWWAPSPMPTVSGCRPGISECYLYELTSDPYEDTDVFSDNMEAGGVVNKIHNRLDYFQSQSADATIESSSGKTSYWKSQGGAVPWEGTSADAVAKESISQTYNTDGEYSPPHIIFVMADDLGLNDVGYRADDCYASDYSDASCAASSWTSPVADALSGDGIRLMNYHVAWVCSPARAMLLTGRYAMRYGMQYAPVLSDLPTDESLLSEELKTAGYKTQMIGKWHLGFYSWDYHPEWRGFDNWYGYYSGYVGYWNKTYGSAGDYQDLTDGTELVTNKTELQQYMGHLLQDKVERAMDAHVNTYGTSTPLFLYYAPELVHDPYEAPEYYLDMCTSPNNDNYADNEYYCAMKIIFDEVMANTTCKMVSTGLAWNSLFVVTTDNGGAGMIKGSNYPWRGKKGTLQEGGVYAGMAFVYGTMVPDKARGSKYYGLMHMTDWMPTLMRLATNNTWTGPRNGYALDGVDQWEAMTANKSYAWTVSNPQFSPRNETLLNVDNVTNKDAAFIWVDPSTGKQWKLIEGGLTSRFSYVTNAMVYEDGNYVQQASCSNTDGDYNGNWVGWPSPTLSPTVSPRPTANPTPTPTSVPTTSPQPTMLPTTSQPTLTQSPTSSAPTPLPTSAPTVDTTPFSITFTADGDNCISSARPYVNYGSKDWLKIRGTLWTGFVRWKMPSGSEATMVEYVSKSDDYWLNVTYIKVGFYTYRDIQTLYLFAENHTGWDEDSFYYNTAPADWGTIQVGQRAGYLSEETWEYVNIDVDTMQQSVSMPKKAGDKIAFTIKSDETNSNEAIYSMDSDMVPTLEIGYQAIVGQPPSEPPTPAPTTCVSNWASCDNGNSVVCCGSGYSCYKKKDSYSQCRTSCPDSSDWACNDEDDGLSAAGAGGVVMLVLLVIVPAIGLSIFTYRRLKQDAHAIKQYEKRMQAAGQPQQAQAPGLPLTGDTSEGPPGIEMTSPSPSSAKPSVQGQTGSMSPGVDGRTSSGHHMLPEEVSSGKKWLDGSQEDAMAHLQAMSGTWNVEGTPTTIKPDGKVLFNGKSYGEEFDIHPSTGGGLVRQDGWGVDLKASMTMRGGHEEFKHIVWRKLDEPDRHPVTWSRMEDSLAASSPASAQI